MTRHGFVLGVMPALVLPLALALPLTLALAACGGSSSETPPPLQPDPRGFHYAGVSALEPDTSDAGAQPSANDAVDDDDKPSAPARATWGGTTPPRPRRGGIAQPQGE